ncbi:MAG TPA: hypothetical protein VII72_18785 [Myxococcota bacterium]|jgi:hypothetical protein
MRQETSDQAILARNSGFVALAALAGAVALIAAGPARANNEFQNGFEDQLGRIAAYGAVNVGLQILTGGYFPAVVPVPVAPVAYYGPGYGAYYGPRTVVVKYPKGHRHGRSCASSHGYYGNQYGYNQRYGYNERWNNDYDDDRGHRGHGKKNRGGHGRGW